MVKLNLTHGPPTYPEHLSEFKGAGRADRLYISAQWDPRSAWLSGRR